MKLQDAPIKTRESLIAKIVGKILFNKYFKFWLIIIVISILTLSIIGLIATIIWVKECIM